MQALLPMPTSQPHIPGADVASAPLLAVVREDIFDDRPPQIVRVNAGETISDLVDRLGFDPIMRDHAVALIDGEEIVPEDWAATRLKDGCHISICIAPQGGDDGNKALTTVLTIFVMVAAFWISGGGLAPMLGTAFAKGSIGATLAATAVSAVGSLAISALVKPPAGPQQDRINPVYSIDGASNQFAPFQPIILSVGRRRVMGRMAARGYQELVGDDFYYRMIIDWGPIGIALSDIKVGDTPIDAIDGVQMQHRLVETDPHPTLYPGHVFQEPVGATLSDMADWEMRRTIPDATEAGVIIGFPAGLGHSSKKGKSEQWAAQVEIRYRRVTGGPGNETLGPWQSPPGNGVFSPRGSVFPGPGRYGVSAKKRNQPFFRAFNFALPEAGLYEISVRRSSPDEDPEDRTFDDMQLAMIESRRPGRPVTREDVAYSVFRFKGSDETSGRVETINAILDRLIPRFDPAFLSGGDLSTAGPQHLTAPQPSSNNWEEILWVYRNGLEGRRPLTDAEIDWPSMAIAAKNANDQGWTFDHVFDGPATVEEAVEMMAFAANGRAGFMGNRLTAVVDGPQLAPVAVLSDRKVRSVRAIKRLSRPPHGFRVQFDDASDGFRTREIIVYVGDHTAETASIFEIIRIPGCVHWPTLHRLVAQNFRNSRLQNRTISCEVLIADIDPAVRRGAWVGLQTKVVEVGRGAGWIRQVERNLMGAVTAVILDQPVSQTVGDDLVLQWNREIGPGLSERLSNALPVAVPVGGAIRERIEFETPVTGSDMPEVGDMYLFGVQGFVRLDGLIDEIETVDHEWLRLHLVDYAPARFDETGLIIPPYTPAYERPAFIRPAELELIAVRQDIDGIVIHFRPRPGPGQISRFIAARALAADEDDEGGEIGAWDPLPEMPATARQLIAPGGQAGDVYVYRIAAVSPDGQIGPYLLVDAIPAIETLPSPRDVVAEGFTEDGVGGSRRAALRVTFEPVEDVQIIEAIIEARRVQYDLGDNRLPEQDQPAFERVAQATPESGQGTARGLPAGAVLDVAVYFVGSNQAISARVRVDDVALPATDVAGAAADFVPGGALQEYIDTMAGGASTDEYARLQAAAALAAADAAFQEAEAVRSEYAAADEDLQTDINSRATIAELGTVASDAAAARGVLGAQITSAYTSAINDAVGDLQGQINNRATVTDLATVASDASTSLAQGLSAVRSEFQTADAALGNAINLRATVAQLNSAVTDAANARAELLTDARAEWVAGDGAVRAGIGDLVNSVLPTRPMNAAHFTGARPGDPNEVPDLGGSMVVDPLLGLCRQLSWTSAGNGALTKGVVPMTPGRVWEVRCLFRIVSVPSSGPVSFSAIFAGLTEAFANDSNQFATAASISVSSTGIHELIARVGSGPGADASYPGSGTIQMRAGLRLSSTASVLVNIAEIELRDVTDQAGLASSLSSKANHSDLITVEANANAAISALNTSMTAQIGAVSGNVSILQGVLARPSSSEAIIAFAANTSSGVASLRVISTAGTLGSGTRIQLDANLVVINGVAISPGTITANRLNVSTLSSITADLGTVTTGLLRNTANTFGVNAALGVQVEFSGTHMKVTGANFGASNNLMEWYGPRPSGATLTNPMLSTLTTSNAIFAKDNAGRLYDRVARMSAAYTAAEVTTPVGVWTALQAVTLTAAGNTLLIAMGFSSSVYIDGVNSYHQARIRRGGTAIYQSGPFNYFFGMGGNSFQQFGGTVIDTPPAGSHTYTMEVYTVGGTLTNTSTASNRSLVITDIRQS